MTTSLRSCWRNCALEADSEILDIDRMEDRLAPIGAKALRIRELVSTPCMPWRTLAVERMASPKSDREDPQHNPLAAIV